MNQIFSVSQVTQYLERTLLMEPFFQRLRIQGQVVNLKKARFVYFDLIDDQALIHCVSFDSNLDRSLLTEGMEAVVEGRLALYKQAGTYQIRISQVSPMGEGARLLKLLALKKKLAAEGLFQKERKRPLPAYPRRIGLISSPKGAVLHDFANELHLRYPLVEVTFSGALVQGQEALKDLVRALDALLIFHQKRPLDVIVLARGGGSNEDLSVFNEEPLVRALAGCPVPIVTAIGHQVDDSLADLVADARASTPTEAASLITPERLSLYQQIDFLHHKADRIMEGRFSTLRYALLRFRRRIDQADPKLSLLQKRTHLQQQMARAEDVIRRKIQTQRRLLGRLIEHSGAVYERLLNELANKAARKEDLSWQLLDASGQVLLPEAELFLHQAYQLEGKAYDYRIEVIEKEQHGREKL